MSAEFQTLTRPLDLRRHLHEPPRSFDPVPLLDLCLIGLFFALFSSRFLFAPGTAIDLPAIPSGQAIGLPADAVLTVRSLGDREVFLFDGRILSDQGLALALQERVARSSNLQPVLLLKADQGLPLERLLEISNQARTAGFATIQLATREENATPAFQRGNP